MRLSVAEGPIHGSALRVSSSHGSATSAPAHRRPIGTGQRPVIVTNPACVSSRRIAHPAKKARTMKRKTFFVTSALALLLSGAAIGIAASVDAPRTLMSPGDYQQSRRAIEAQSRMELARCRTEDALAKDVCKAQVRAQERVLKAQLQARYHGTAASAEDARLARVRGDYEVARARCGAQKGDGRAQCLKAAREDQGRALSLAKLSTT